MKILHNCPLSNYSTFKMGGIALNLYLPESVDDLLSLEFDTPLYLISNGSNVIINDKRQFDNVVCMKRFDGTICDLGDGRFRVGSGASIQRLISTINSFGYGGIEELVSIPGKIGGLIAMNASVPSADVCISDYLELVEIVSCGKRYELSNCECQFGYRRSRFDGSKEIITSAVFRFPRQPRQVSSERMQKRIDECRKNQIRNAPNVGSIFSECNRYILVFASKLFSRSDQIEFSSKNINWWINRGGSYSQVRRIVHFIIRAHKLFGLKCEIEVKLWD